MTYEDLASKWTASVKSYFDKYMKSDLLKYSGRWIIEKFPGLYVPYSCIKGLQPTEKTPIWNRKEKTSCWKYVRA